MDNVMTKRTFNLNLRIAPELDQEFDLNAKRIGQTKSNLVVMLMEAFNKALDRDGNVMMPLQVKTASSADGGTVVSPVINGHGNHVKAHTRAMNK